MAICESMRCRSEPVEVRVGATVALMLFRLMELRWCRFVLLEPRPGPGPAFLWPCDFTKMP